ncbi:hypothetical protein MKX01_014606 [Papaver californicum]|nr:hypothetical protein MKX01_014606 [Papaver californicum]
MSISANEFHQDNDSETNNLVDDGPDYDQPISTDYDEIEEENIQMISNGRIKPEVGIHTLNLNNDEEEVEETIEEEAAAALNSEISRAFIEDEKRRNAPLTPENTNRIMDAMRGISFQGGFVPDWINQVPDDRWIHHLRNLRQKNNPILLLVLVLLLLTASMNFVDTVGFDLVCVMFVSEFEFNLLALSIS